jgi:transposase
MQRSFAAMMQQVETLDYKTLYEQQLTKTAALESTIAAFESTVAALTHQLDQLKKMIFGSRQERFVPTATADKNDPQLRLDLDVESTHTCKITGAVKVSYTRTKTEVLPHPPKAHPGRMALPAHLEREVIITQPDGDISGLEKIGETITEVLDYTPGKLFVKQYIQCRYALPCGDGTTVLTASLPPRTLEKCMASEALVAQVIVDKYMDHIPANRQLQRFERQGVKIAPSTIYDWIKTGLNFLLALYLVHKRMVLESRYLQADETGIKVLDENSKGTTHKGYYWVYHNSIDKIVLFDYQPGRGREGPDDVLKEYQGYLQTDGYTAYDDFEKRPGITLMHCMAHARRKFSEALAGDKTRAEHALKMFGDLYAIERKIKEKGLKEEALLHMRQHYSVPVLKALKEWMVAEYPKVLPKSPIGMAIAYCLPRWEKLSIYTTNALLNIDNNPVEGVIRPLAVGRRNYLFAGSHEAAQRAAMAYSLFATCRLHQINPYEWLRDVLERMHLYTTSNLKELLPQCWKKPVI